MLTESEVWALMSERLNRAEIAAACQCDETVAKALMVKAAMSRGIDERNPRQLMHLSRTAGHFSASPHPKELFVRLIPSQTDNSYGNEDEN